MESIVYIKIGQKNWDKIKESKGVQTIEDYSGYYMRKVKIGDTIYQEYSDEKIFSKVVGVEKNRLKLVNI